jgi:hypothetical protein
MTMDDWNSDEMKAATVIPQVDAVAVYVNSLGDVTIRQRGSNGEDAFISFPRSAVSAVVKALKDAAKG